MKKLLFLAALCLAAFACGSKEDPKEEQPATITLPEGLADTGVDLGFDGMPVKFVITSTADWTLETEDVKSSSWLKLDPLSGKGGQPVTVTVSASENTTEKERLAKVTVKSVKNSKTFTVKQAFKQPAVQGVKAGYNDFVGNWLVTGTEHVWFYSFEEVKNPKTYTYDIQIEADETGKTYRILNWETGATAEDRKNLYYGSKVEQSIYDYLRNVAKVPAAVKAWYDADLGQMHIDMQVLYTNPSKPQTVEFLGDTVDPDGHMCIGSFNSKPGDTDRAYTICDFILLKDGTVHIDKSTLEGKTYSPYMAFMGYARYDGFLQEMHFNKHFAFPFSMKHKQ